MQGRRKPGVPLRRNQIDKKSIIMMKKKILFLDNDGVICLTNNFGSRDKKWQKWQRSLNDSQVSRLLKDAPVGVRFDNFDAKAVKLLNRVLEETGCEYVVSSDWRLHATLEELQIYYKEQGIIKEPCGMTRTYEELLEIHGESKMQIWHDPFRKDGYEQARSLEILAYIEEHGIESWCAIDDLNLGVVQFGLNMEGTCEQEYIKYGLKNFVHLPRINEGIKQSGKVQAIIEMLGT